MAEATAMTPLPDTAAASTDDSKAQVDGAAVEDHEPGRIVRTKEHPAKPTTVDDALYEMELVGHDFFLFHDKRATSPASCTAATPTTTV